MDLIGMFDVFLIDQFGTIHDGEVLYPGAADAIAALKESGATIILVSNSGRRAAVNAGRLAQMGLAPESYDRCVTSGEVAWRMLRDGAIPAARGARRCLLLERGDGGALDGLDLERVTDPAQAQIVVIAGSEGDSRDLASYEALLAPAARAELPCLCVNPDRTMVTPRGLAFGSGVIAELYEKLGGAVTWVGKPYAAIYEFSLRGLSIPDRARVVGVGDSVEHDIAGARAAGCRGWLVRNGILADADDAAITTECARVGIQPDGVLRRF